MNIFQLFEVESIKSSFRYIQTLNIPPEIFYGHFCLWTSRTVFYTSDKNMNAGKYVSRFVMLASNGAWHSVLFIHYVSGSPCRVFIGICVSRSNGMHSRL